ncbi:MAG TPA: Glu-tRNA(Gln) amidotransferase subunit GatD [Candidatus Krumholzibacteria bacterium]|nr:Glu-tRNA(Gln) amidotransferase subunit GatD [Candidatus Krumholzibacteria bacterium]HPD72446.1 Glu-tRNA(Gln) amidotransferase subunit GatD [Candidatus Krumholzibacteria bacterium]HRY40622.1 Glu-tRNA(Gln) amidotransferase subunit GatD [Candidatus Krumholzibacteria bacterium]
MSDANDFPGYRSPALDVLEQQKAPVWSQATLHTSRGDFSGLILPRSETADAAHIVLKLDTGYNIGVRADTVRRITVHGRKVAHYKIPEKAFPYDPVKPRVKLIGTGGTIASRLDYRTGAVIPAFSPGELYGSVPELADVCNLETEKLYGVFSENMGPEQWMGTARAIAAEIEKGVAGIVVGHGTDTMHHTAAALTFMLQELPVPVVMVGSQRSSDRPSSDAAINLINAARTAATSDIAEVMVCMFGPTSDQYGLLHRGTRVRKMHSSYRSTFRTISDIPLARVDSEGVKPFRGDYNRRRDVKQVALKACFDDRVAIVYYYPNMKPDIIDSLIDHGYRGIIIAGTGLGHVNKPLYPALERARTAGAHVYMTVQTLWGYVQMYVYETGREIMELGVIPAANMMPEVAYVKLGWALGQSQDHDEVKRLMLTPVNGEITEREPHNGYLVMQGGIPEVDAFISEHWK